jgi:hypothetical protein
MHKIQANVHKKPGDWLLRRRPANNKFLFFICSPSHPGCRAPHSPYAHTARSSFLLINFHWRDAAIIKSRRLYSPPRPLNNQLEKKARFVHSFCAPMSIAWRAFNSAERLLSHELFKIRSIRDGASKIMQIVLDPIGNLVFILQVLSMAELFHIILAVISG